MNAPHASSYRGWSGRRPRRDRARDPHHLLLPTPSPRSLSTSSASFWRPQRGQRLSTDDACSDGCAQVSRLSLPGYGCDADSGRKLKLLARRFKAEWTDSACAICVTEGTTTRSEPCTSAFIPLVCQKPNAQLRLAHRVSVADGARLRFQLGLRTVRWKYRSGVKSHYRTIAKGS